MKVIAYLFVVIRAFPVVPVSGLVVSELAVGPLVRDEVCGGSEHVEADFAFVNDV